MPTDGRSIMVFDSVILYGSLQCSDTVGWVTGRASGLKKTECWWFVSSDDLTGDLHML